MGFKYLQKILFAISFSLFMLLVNSAKAQSEAVISGKILNLPPHILHLHYRNNPFLFEESENYVALDSNDSFNIRIQLLAPQIIYIDLLGTKLKLYIAPNDNLNIKLDCKKKVSEAIFEGTNVANNIFLAKSVGQIPDWVDETEIKKAQKSKTAQEYQTFIESLFEEKKHFLDNYPIAEISNFSADFLDFVFYDLHFWKSRLMLEYYIENKNSTDPLHIPDEAFLSFIFETELSTNSAYNNDNYLSYLQLHLAYLKDKKIFPEKVGVDLTTETVRLVQTAKPISGTVFVLEDPFTSKEIVDWLSNSNSGTFLNIITTEKFKYIGNDTTFEDTFIKVKTLNGRIGWVPNSAIYLAEDKIIDSKHIPRYCLDAETPLCGLEKVISGRALYLAGAIDIIRSALQSDPNVIETRYNNFFQANLLFPDINNYLKKAYKATLININKGIKEIGLPHQTSLLVTNQSKVLTNSSAPKTTTVLTNNTTKIPETILETRPFPPVPANVNSTPTPETKKKDNLVIEELPLYYNIVVEIPKTTFNFAKSSLFLEAVKLPDSVITWEQKADFLTDRDTLNGTIVSDTLLNSSIPITSKNTDSLVVDFRTNNSDSVATNDTNKTLQKENAKTSTSIEVIAEKNTEEQVPGAKKIVSDIDKFNQSKTETVLNPKPVPQPTKTEPKAAEQRSTRILITDVDQPDLKILSDDSNSADQKRTSQTTKISEPKAPSSSGSTTSFSNFAAGKYFLPDPTLNTDVEVVPLYKPTNSESMKFNGLTINERIPDFTFQDINGKEIKSQDLLGKIVYLDFWATWCAPCQAEMTRAQGMAERLKDKDIVFIFVSTDEDSQLWRDQVKSQKYAGIHANDRVIIPINFMVEALPNYFIIDKKGRVAYNSLIKSHYTSEEMVEKLLSIP